VARRLPSFGDVQRIAALASLDVSSQPDPPPAKPNRDPNIED
jgi:hypothetical protein